MASTPRGSYSSLDLSTEVPLSTEDEDLAAVEGFASFIPLLRFQTDKLFGVVALPVFYLVACALLLMNFLTLALPILGFDLVDSSESGANAPNLNHAMAGPWQTLAFTVLNLLILHWHRLLQQRVQTLVPESLSARLRRRCCRGAEGGEPSAEGSLERSRDSWREQASAAKHEQAGLLQPTASSIMSPNVLTRSASSVDRAELKPKQGGDIYISHGESPRDVGAARNIVEALPGNLSWISEDIRATGGEEAWLKESHIAEAMGDTKTFVALISADSLRRMSNAHEVWNLSVAEWDKALELHKQGSVTIVTAWIGEVDAAELAAGLSDEAPKGGKETMQGEELFDSRSERRSCKMIVEEMLALAKNSQRLTAAKSGGGDGEGQASLMLSYRVTETGDPRDTKEDKKKGDNFTPRLQRALEARGYSCFVGEKQLEGGDEWATTIAKAVKGCKAMLIVSSPTYGMTKWTFRELQMADNNAKKLIPIYHSGNFPPNDKVEVFLGGTQYIDFSSGHERTFDVSPAMVCPGHLGRLTQTVAANRRR